MINSDTKLYGVFGDPVEGSLSPKILNTLFAHYQINGAYLAFHVPKEDLKNAIAGSRALGIEGFNITIPHKERVLDYLDGLDLKANQIGAVNTVNRIENQLIGYNTDIVGFLKAFKEHFGEVHKGKKSAVLGAGGSARAVVYGLLEEGFSSIFLINRTLKRANQVIEALSSNFQEVEIETHPLTKEVLEGVFPRTDFLINTLPEEGILENPWILSSLQKAPSFLKIYDLQYRELKSNAEKRPSRIRQRKSEGNLVEEAHKLKMTAYGGLTMLVAQAVESFSIWTGIKPDWREVLKTVSRIGQASGRSSSS